MEQSRFDPASLISVVQTCARGKEVGAFVSTSEAIEELRILSGDFVTSDEDAANAVSEVALKMGCSVLFDEQCGADVLNL